MHDGILHEGSLHDKNQHEGSLNGGNLHGGFVHQDIPTLRIPVKESLYDGVPCAMDSCRKVPCVITDSCMEGTCMKALSAKKSSRQGFRSKEFPMAGSSHAWGAKMPLHKASPCEGSSHQGQLH